MSIVALMPAVFGVLVAAIPNAQAQSATPQVNILESIGKNLAAGCNGKNSYVLLWSRDHMVGDQKTPYVNNAAGVLEAEVNICMSRGYVPSGGVFIYPGDNALWEQAVVLKSALASSGPASEPSSGSPGAGQPTATPRP
jgi:hypothetical protein